MTDEKKKMTAQGSSVGADDGQSISKNSENSIPTSGQKSNDEIVNSQDSLEEMYRKMQRMTDPRYLHTGVLLCHSNGSHSFDFKCDKIVDCFGCNDLLQYRLKLFRCIWHLSEQEIHISRNTAIEIREGLEEQSAFENQVFRIF